MVILSSSKDLIWALISRCLKVSDKVPSMIHILQGRNDNLLLSPLAYTVCRRGVWGEGVVALAGL